MNSSSGDDVTDCWRGGGIVALRSGGCAVGVVVRGGVVPLAGERVDPNEPGLVGARGTFTGGFEPVRERSNGGCEIGRGVAAREMTGDTAGGRTRSPSSCGELGRNGGSSSAIG